MTRYKGRFGDLRDIPDRIRTLGEQLALLGDPKRLYAVAKEKIGQRAVVEAAIQTATQKIQSQQRDMASLQEQMEQFADLDSQADSAVAELQVHQTAYQAVLANQRLANMVDARRADVEQYLQLRDQAQVELASTGKKLAEVEAGFDIATYQHLVTREQEMRSESGALDARLTMHADNQRKDEAEIAALKTIQIEMVEAQAQQASLADQEETLDTIRSLLRQAGPYITSVMIRQISDGARGIYSDIMQDYSRHLTWNDDYGITLEVDGHNRQFSQLSGGEQMSAALALRLALLREMSNIDVAFFDEPTANLDENRRDSLARQILQVRASGSCSSSATTTPLSRPLRT